MLCSVHTSQELERIRLAMPLCGHVDMESDTDHLKDTVLEILIREVQQRVIVGAEVVTLRSLCEGFDTLLASEPVTGKESIPAE